METWFSYSLPILDVWITTVIEENTKIHTNRERGGKDSTEIARIMWLIKGKIH